MRGVYNLFFNVFFFIQDFSVNMASVSLKLKMPIDNIHMEGTLSQICYLGLSLNFILENFSSTSPFVECIFFIIILYKSGHNRGVSYRLLRSCSLQAGHMVMLFSHKGSNHSGAPSA